MVRTSIFFLVAWLATAAGLVPSSSRRAWVKQATAGAASTAAALSTPSWASAAAPAKKGKAASAAAAAAPAPAPAPVAPDPADILVSGTVSIFEEEDPEMRRTIAAMRTADRAALYVTVKPGGESSRVSGLMRGNTGVAAGAIRCGSEANERWQTLRRRQHPSPISAAIVTATRHHSIATRRTCRIPIKDLTFPYEFTVTKSNLFPEAVKYANPPTKPATRQAAPSRAKPHDAPLLTRVRPTHQQF